MTKTASYGPPAVVIHVGEAVREFDGLKKLPESKLTKILRILSFTILGSGTPLLVMPKIWLLRLLLLLESNMPLMYEPCPDAIYPEGESLTEQEHAAECDINRIMARAKAGLPITGSAFSPVYGDDDLNQDLMSVN